MAHGFRKVATSPSQSYFRVCSVLRFRRPDGSEDFIAANNGEPCDGNITGAICAERVAVCRFNAEEEANGSKIFRITVATDSQRRIFPGPMCREFLTSTCDPDTEITASGRGDPKSFESRPLRDLFPLPSVYRLRDRNSMVLLAQELMPKVGPPTDSNLKEAYDAALTVAKQPSQKVQMEVFPIVYAAAVRFEDGRISVTSELKGIEYGCTVDAVSQLLPEIIRSKEAGLAKPCCIVQTDQYGIAHAPFARARSLLVEHGFQDVLLAAHLDSGDWSETMPAISLLPWAFLEW